MSQFKKTSTSSHSDFAIECDTTDSINSLQGQLLIASPHMDDTRFKRSVIMICQHDAQSAMGLVINKQASSLKLGDLYEKLDIGAPRFAVEDSLAAVAGAAARADRRRAAARAHAAAVRRRRRRARVLGGGGGGGGARDGAALRRRVLRRLRLPREFGGQGARVIACRFKHNVLGARYAR